MCSIYLFYAPKFDLDLYQDLKKGVCVLIFIIEESNKTKTFLCFGATSKNVVQKDFS